MTGSLAFTCNWRIFLQTEMCSNFVVIFCVSFQNAEAPELFALKSQTDVLGLCSQQATPLWGAPNPAEIRPEHPANLSHIGFCVS